jgi:hypothetical protein
MPTATPACYLLLLACTSTWRKGLVGLVLEERRWNGYTDANGVVQEDHCSVVHQHSQGVLNYMFVGGKIWRLENHTMPGHTLEVTQVPGDLIWLPPGWFHSVTQ